jgi:hypothetical protein
MARGVPSKAVLRMGHVRDIQNQMMESLFNDRLIQARVDTELRQIAHANAILINSPTITFMFGSEWFPRLNTPIDPSSNKTLHGDFRVRVDELVNGIDSKARAFKAAISTLISNILSVARHTDDLYSLFPKELQAVFPVINTNIFNIGSPLTPEEVTNIYIINKPNLSIFHKLLMNRLLCAQVKP